MVDTTRRTLAALTRLRHIETDRARRALAEALAHEATLSAEHTAIERQIAAERRRDGDFDRDAFAAWLMRMRAQQARLADASREAQARTAAARADLAARRMAETTAEERMAETIAAHDAELARKDQVVLDDAARALWLMGRS